MAFTITKVAKAYYVQLDGGFPYRFPSFKAAEADVARRERLAIEAEVIRAEYRAARLDAVNAYLAVRAARRAADTQVSFNF